MSEVSDELGECLSLKDSSWVTSDLLSNESLPPRPSLKLRSQTDRPCDELESKTLKTSPSSSSKRNSNPEANNFPKMVR